MKVEGKLYLTGSDNALPAFLSASDEERAGMIHFYTGVLDMSHFWVPVGTFEAVLDFDKSKSLTQQAVAAVEHQLADLNQKYFMAKQELEARRANLLCLEAPKE